ncbi:MAG: ABC transporter ATP-binding protein [Verrucomicrobia bacterium]|nr:ABC transporter ATP-binding protein [Verrucomicrobiota bacterium]
MSQEYAIAVEELSKRYVIGHAVAHDTFRDRLGHGLRGLFRRTAPRNEEEFWALRDVSFHVRPGEVVGVIGRNGAGKSTLLKVLSRITEPTAGRARLHGRVASLLEVGTGFHPELTGRENIFLNGAILGMRRTEIRRKFDEIVAFAEVDRFIDTPVKRYSSGMYVRLAFAVAAHLEPEILIVDEVLAVGDAAFQDKCLGKMESIVRGQARTILFVSHNVSAITRLCSRCVLLDQGRLVADATPEAAVSAYLAAGQAHSTSGIDLSRTTPSAESPIRLLSVVFNGGAPLLNRRPLRIVLRLHAALPVEKFGLGIGFCHLDGRRVLTLESDYHNGFLRAPHAGEHTVAVEIPCLDLVPGRYRIDVGAFGGSRQNYHYAGDCAVAEVQPSPDTPAHVHGISGDWRPGLQWQLL